MSETGAPDTGRTQDECRLGGACGGCENIFLYLKLTPEYILDSFFCVTGQDTVIDNSREEEPRDPPPYPYKPPDNWLMITGEGGGADPSPEPHSHITQCKFQKRT